MGKFNEYLNKKIVPIPALYKNPYLGILKDLVSKENKGETVAKEYVKTQLDADYLNRIKNDIYEYPPYAKALEVPMLQDLKNIYLKTPQTFSSFGISKYRPKNGTQPYYFNSKILDTVGAGIVVKAGDNLKKEEVVPTDKLEDMNYGEISHITPNNNAVAILPGIGHATVGIGHDQKGEYVSYYDNWDVGNFKPNTKHLIDFFNRGVPVYGRVYLDDYYDIPEEARGNPFITPAVVTAYKKGGRIHIKKKNRGKFTAAAKRAGMGVQEFARHVLANKDKYSSTLVKRANFARNSKKFKHENGGILKAQDSAKLSSGYTQYNGSDLSDIETFNKNWLNHRDSQLAKQGLLDPEIKNNLNWWNRNMHVSNKKVADIIRNRLFSNLDETKEFSTTSALKDRKGYQVLKNKLYKDYPIFEWDGHDLIGPPKPFNPEILRHVFETSSAGIYSPEYRTIVYNKDFINTPTKIHERDHAMFAPINSEFSGINAIDKETYRFKDWEVPERWGYYEDPLEIRARLMQMRFDNKLDPKHEYSDEEIENMRNDPNFKDYKIFERYNNEYIKFLLNDVAQNNMGKNRPNYRSSINFTKDGGILKAQEGTGNLYTPHPLSPVGIALNQAKAMAKGKTHLPPGVKEVVGPDGKKVAIRTEQPLVPLEQSIAEWLPGTGDVAEVGYIANDVKNGNYGTAALGAGLMFIPGNAGKLLSKHRKAVSKTADTVEDAVRKANVSEYINTVDDALPERQPLTTNKSKQFWTGTSESKLTDAEKEGIPKGKRNQPIKVKTHNEKQITPLLSAKYIQRFEAPPLDPDYPEISNLQRAKYRRLMDDKFENIFDNTEGFNKTLQSYIDGLPNEIDPRFASITDGEIIQPSIAVRGYRNYLLNNGVDAADISDDNLARLLTQEYKNLSNTATGKLKNILLWHGSPTQFDSFDFSKTSANTGNSGALGPGNYFSTHGGRYGHARNKFDYSLEMNNFQPYIVSNITSTPAGHDMVEKGLLPKFIDSYAMRSANNQAILQKWISEIPTNDNRAYIDFTEAVNGYFDGPRAGIMIRRNTGIKSLYPHPSRFIRNTDGTITLIPADWNDARVNFKNGGKL